jgi:peptidyl-prolyl cis-trans isomerase A (cyclophilin A)
MKESHTLKILFLALVLVMSGCSNRHPVVRIITSEGNIDIEIYSDRAPVTAANFLKYVDSALFRGGCFYRVVRDDNQPHNDVKIEVIQGGRLIETGGFAPILHETTAQTGILHRDGIISMARDAPGTATSEFFICVGDQPSLDFGGKRNPDGQGFAAFGKVISGMETVRKIHSIEAPSQYLDSKVLIKDIVRKSFKKDSKY